MENLKSELTFKHNLKFGRHGWLRLTPAHSVRVVHNILERHPEISHLLDPFSGTGTTGLVCGERGIRCDLLDINPFLVWLARVKTANYKPEELRQARISSTSAVAEALSSRAADNLWLPAISNITRWWPANKCAFLAKLHHALNQRFPQESAAKNLLYKMGIERHPHSVFRI